MKLIKLSLCFIFHIIICSNFALHSVFVCRFQIFLYRWILEKYENMYGNINTTNLTISCHNPRFLANQQTFYFRIFYLQPFYNFGASNDTSAYVIFNRNWCCRKVYINFRGKCHWVLRLRCRLFANAASKIVAPVFYLINLTGAIKFYPQSFRNVSIIVELLYDSNVSQHKIHGGFQITTNLLSPLLNLMKKYHFKLKIK